MKKLKIVTVIIVKAAYQEELLGLFHTVVNKSREESGCISYDLYQDTKYSLKYTLVENWISQQAINEHNISTHFREFVAAAETKIDSVYVDKMKRIY